MKPSKFEQYNCDFNQSAVIQTDAKTVNRLFTKHRRRIIQYISATGIIIALYSWFNIYTEQPEISATQQNKLVNAKNGAHENNAATNNTLNTTKKNTLTNAKTQEEPPERDLLFHTIKSGDSLGSIMKKYGFPLTYPHHIVRAENGEHFKNIRIGKQLQFGLNPKTSELEEIRYPLSKLLTLVATINDDISIAINNVPYETHKVTASGTINQSLFDSALNAGIDQNMIMELSEVFGWDIDFGRDIKQGDTYKFIYEQYVNNGEVLQNGNILSAEFINNGEKFIAIRYEDSDGNASYYAPDGSSMKGTFLKSPMKFSRVSSRFSKRRFHPILKKWRSHKGVDYAARTGTPIRTVADGKIIFQGRKGGYGRTVIISHGGKYTTLYAHMNKYNKKLRSGKYVKQGQTIGYVGSTGLATGPHLHYEFRVNGVHRNPLTYKTPKATAIKKSELEKFAVVANEQINLLSKVETDTKEKHIASRTQ